MSVRVLPLLLHDDGGLTRRNVSIDHLVIAGWTGRDRAAVEKHIAELEQEVKYWKEKSDSQDKELYKLKVQINVLKGSRGMASDDDASDAAGAAAKKTDDSKRD